MLHARKDYARIQDPANKIPKDEPVFLIRGQDAIAPMVLEYYANRAQDAGCAPELVDSVRAHSLRMAKWKNKKLADLPSEDTNGANTAASGTKA